MDSPDPERVHETSSPRNRRSTKSLQKRKRGKNWRYWLIKGIIDEKEDKGSTVFLIDWDGLDSKTSAPYEPSWENSGNVTAAAIAEWRQKKSDGSNKLLGTDCTPSSTYDSGPESQPIPSVKRKRPDQGEKKSPVSKKPRRVGTAETARFQAVAQQITSQLPQEIKDSYEEELSNENAQIRVVVPAPGEDFDRDAYVKLATASSQTSQSSQESQHSEAYSDPQAFPSGAILRSQLQPPQKSYHSPYAPSPSQSKTPRPPPKPYLWDEDTPVVPDSQELLDSSSYELSQDQASETGIRTRPNTARKDADIESSLLERQARSSQVPHDSRGTTSRRSSLLSDPLEIENSNENPEIIPSQCEVSVCATSSGVQSQISLSAASRETWPEAGQISSQAQSSSLDSPQFQTQLPLPRAVYNKARSNDIDNSDNSHPESNASNNQPTSSEHSDSQTLGAVPQDSQSVLAQTSRSISEPVWQAAQVIPPDPHPSTETPFPQESDTTSIEALNLQPIECGSLQAGITQLLESSSLSQLNPEIVEPSTSLVRDSYCQESDPPNKVVNPNYQDSVNQLVASIESSEQTSSIAARPSPLESSSIEASFSSHNNSSLQTESTKVDKMADQVMDSSSIAEMLKRSRANVIAATLARQAARRATSSVPSTPTPTSLLPSEMAPLRDLPTDPTLVQDDAAENPVILTNSTSSPKSSPDFEHEQKSHGLRLLPLGPMEYAAPLPMVALVRDMYKAEVANNETYIRALHEEKIDSDGFDRLDIMLDHLKMLCDHQSLVESSYATQENLSDAETTLFAENISTKCQFLAGLLRELRSYDTHIAILVRPGRLRGILEAMCRQYEIGGQPASWPLRVTLISSNIDESSELGPVSLVVAFDTSGQGNYPKLRALGSGRLAPLVHLLITHSIEHLELCIDGDIRSLDRTVLLVDGVKYMLPNLGILDHKLYSEAEQAGKSVAEYLKPSSSDNYWPLLSMPEIEGLEFEYETSSQSEVKESHPTGSATQSQITSSPGPSAQSGFKRRLQSDEDASDLYKRQRVVPAPGKESDYKEVSVISETVLAHSNEAPIPGAHEDSVAMSTSVTGVLGDHEREDQISTLLNKVVRLEDELRNKEAAEAELRQYNQRLEARCEDYKKSIDEIQPKYQEALNDQGHFQHEMTEALSRENNMRQRYGARTAELTKIRGDKAVTDAELSAARKALSSSTIPAIAEFNKLEDELNAMRAENLRLQKRVANMQSEIEYMRGNYQTASSAAADVANEVLALKEENAVLARKASDNAKQIHLIQASSEIKQHLDHIEEIENQKAELERELNKKSEELKTLLHGRRATRATSVPRSPRMGTMSPNVRDRRVLGAGAGVGSRGNSPAPGDAGLPYKGTFGDALMYSEKGSGRWGNHLQM